jgi:hypothetical protein
VTNEELMNISFLKIPLEFQIYFVVDVDCCGLKKRKNKMNLSFLYGHVRAIIEINDGSLNNKYPFFFATPFPFLMLFAAFFYL